MDVSLRHLLDRYRDEHELLKHVLMAKVEEDKKLASQDTLKIEQARIQLRQLDLELMREHGKATIRYYDKQHTTPGYITPAPPPTHLPPPPGMGNSVTTHSTAANAPTLSGPHTTLPPISSSQYHGLAPVQQQVLARITSSPSSGHTEAYPHSAHPLCPPSDPHAYRRNNRLYPGQQPATPISPGGALNGDDKMVRKRSRNSVNDLGGDGESGNTSSLTHVQVMEALKAKIQRGSNSTNSNSSGSNSAHADLQTDRGHSNGNSNSSNTSKRARTTISTATLSSIKTEADRDCIVPSTSSPRSAKPILPPIDTSVGRVRSSTTNTTNITATSTNNNHHEQHRLESNNRYHTTSPAERALREQPSSKQDGSNGKNAAATAATGPSSSSSSSSSSETTTASSS